MKTKFTLLTNLKQPLISLLVVGLLMTLTSPVIGQYINTHIFDKAPVLLSDQAPNGWYPDRYAPNSFTVTTAPATYATALKESISSADGALTRSPNDAFYNTQGRSLILPDGTLEISANLYIPASWADTHKRMAGLWAAGAKADGTISETYPVLEFSSDDPAGGTNYQPRFQGFDDQTDTWISLGLPTDFQYDQWYTLNIKIDPSTPQTTYTVADKQLNVSSADIQNLHHVILQGYNYDPAYPLNAQNPGVDYDIYWHDITSISTGNNVFNTTAETYYPSIRQAVSQATSGDHLVVSGTGFNEQIIIDKPLTLEGDAAFQSAKPLLDFTGTATGKSSIIDISANNVLIKNLDFHVDLSKINSAVIASSASMDTISIVGNHVSPYKSTGDFAGAYGLRNAFSINYATYRAGGDHGVYFEGNTVDADLSNNIIFRSGLSADVCTGQFLNNTLQTLNQDLTIRFFKNGIINIQNNHFNGGGLEIATPESKNGLVDIENNTFNGAMGSQYTSSLRIKDNFDFMPAVIKNNQFTNHNWAISVENFSNISIEDNTFTPDANSTTFRDITFNTKDLSSSSGHGDAAIGGSVTGNIFNGNSQQGAGTAIALYNHDSQDATIYPFTIGQKDHENVFAASIGKAIYLDNHGGVTSTDLTSAFPEYTGLPATNTDYWQTDIDATHNIFKVGPEGAGVICANMTYYQAQAAKQQIFDQQNDQHIARVILKTPVINVTKEAASTTAEQFRYATLQEAINAASINDSLYASPWVYREDININKEGLKLSGALQYGVDTTILSGPNSGSENTLIITAKNVHVTHLMVTREGNNITEFATNVKNQGIHILGPEGVVLQHLLVTGNRSGIYINHTNGTIIDSCDILFNRTGIQLVNTCDNTVITHNNIKDNWTSGVLLYELSAGATKNITANYNNFSGNWYTDVENRSSENTLDFNGNNWNTETIQPIDQQAGEPGYADLIPAKYGGTASYDNNGSHHQITGGINGVDYSAWLPNTAINAIDNSKYPGFAPVDTAIVYIDDIVQTAPGMTKMARAQSIVGVGGKIISVSDVLHQTIEPGKPFTLESTSGNLTIDGIDFGSDPSPAPIEIDQNITISNTLNLGNGAIIMGAGKTLTLDAANANIDLSGGNGYINGTLVVNNVPSSGSYTFPVGSETAGAQYIEFAPTGGSGGSFAVSYSDQGYSDFDLAGDDPENLTSVDQHRFWNFERTSGDLKGLVTIQDYTNSLPEHAVIAHYGSDHKWHNLGGVFIQEKDPQILQATIESDEFSPFTIGSTEAALPVAITGFKANIAGQQVQFNWESLTENNCKGFGIERSKDGKSWQQIAFIPSQANGGNSTSPLYYTAMDLQPMAGINYYRLRQDLKNAVSAFSDIKTIQFEGKKNIHVYPNPAADKITISGMTGTIYIYNNSGKLQMTQKVQSATQQVSVERLATGLYFIKDSAGHTTQFIKK